MKIAGIPTKLRIPWMINYVLVKFMHPVGNNFRWPTRTDRTQCHKDFILYVGCNPRPTQVKETCRTWSIDNKDDIDNIYREFATSNFDK